MASAGQSRQASQEGRTQLHRPLTSLSRPSAAVTWCTSVIGRQAPPRSQSHHRGAATQGSRELGYAPGGRRLPQGHQPLTLPDDDRNLEADWRTEERAFCGHSRMTTRFTTSSELGAEISTRPKFPSQPDGPANMGCSYFTREGNNEAEHLTQDHRAGGPGALSCWNPEPTSGAGLAGASLVGHLPNPLPKRHSRSFHHLPLGPPSWTEVKPRSWSKHTWLEREEIL